jgi:hypothetical protein
MNARRTKILKKSYEKELKDYKDSVMNGSALSKAVITRKSSESSPEVPKPKRIKTKERVINDVDAGRIMASQIKADARHCKSQQIW